MDQFRQSPPVSRTFAAAIFVLSMLVTVRVISPARLHFDWHYITLGFPQIWRFFTSFLLTGGFGILMMPYSIWQYGGALERDSLRFDSATLLVYFLFVGSLILGLSNYIFGSAFFIDSMVLALIWTYAQDNRGQIVSYFGINIPVMYFPYVILFGTLITGGPEAMICQALAIPVAHAWDFLTHYWPTYGGGVNLIPTPAFLTNYFVGPTGSKQTQRKGHGTSIRTAEPANSAFSSGNSWGQRGTGRRLGGD